MPAEATWFGPPDRPLAGWLHVPDHDRARGGVLLCPPIGLEYVTSHRTIRTTAEELVSRDLVVLRFDYDGTGDSVGDPDDPDRVGAWIASIHAATEELRSVVADLPIAMLGMRLGATLLLTDLGTRRTAGPPVHALVLWDAVPSGRRFLREQRALGRVAGGLDDSTGSIDAPGFRYTAETAHAVGQLPPAIATALPVKRVLELVRVGQDPSPSLAFHPGLESVAVAGMSEMLDVPSPFSVVPTAAVARCIGWLDEAMPRARAPVEPRWIAEATVGAGIVERHVRLGSTGLTAVETIPTKSGTGRPVLLLNNAAESHIGPVRLWTELARAWAEQGVRSIRADISGIGDSPTRVGCDEDVMYARYDVHDVHEIVGELGSIAPPVLVGLCSGGHLALRSAVSIPAASVVAVNVGTTAAIGPIRVGPQAGRVIDLDRAWPRRVLRMLGMPHAGRRLMQRVEATLVGLPDWLWLGLVRLRVVISPAVGLASLINVDATIICGPEDGVGYLTRGRRELTRARRAGLEFLVVEDVDHVPMAQRQRTVVKGLLTEQILRRVSGP